MLHPRSEMQCHVFARSLMYWVKQSETMQPNGMYAKIFPAYWMPPYTLGDGTNYLVNDAVVREACGILIKHTIYLTLFSFQARTVWRAFGCLPWALQERALEILKEYYE